MNTMQIPDAMQTGRNKIILTIRQKNIIRQLLYSTAQTPVTAALLADALHVSSRTILRELPAIEQWLEQNDFRFSRRPGVGLILEENEENRQLIAELLDVDSVRRKWPRTTRRRGMLASLLFAEQPIKSYQFISDYQLSEGTLSGDLHAVAAWLASYHIKLVARPGVGLFLESSESSYRQAIANMIYDCMNETQMMQLFCGQAAPPDTPFQQLFDILDSAVTQPVSALLGQTAKHMHIQFTDSAFVSLIVHISLIIQRIRAGKIVALQPEKHQQVMLLSKYSAAEAIADCISKQFSIVIPPEEIDYLAIHLTAARIWPSEQPLGLDEEQINLRQLMRELIRRFDAELNVKLYTNRLLDDLCNHAGPMLTRLLYHIRIENVQLETMQAEYPHIMQAVRKSSVVICQQLHIDAIPETELAFLAMHFGAAMERLQQEQRRLPVMLVCPSGVGPARILETGLRKHFPSLDIRGVLSAFCIEEEQLRQQGIRLLISTIPLETAYSSLCVSPILQSQDIRRIAQTLSTLHADAPIAPPQRQTDAADIQFITDVGTNLLNLLSDLRFDTLTIQTRADAIAAAGRLFAVDARAATDIEEGLYERDQLADTYISSLHTLMLHCETAMVPHTRFGYLRFAPPLKENEHSICGAFILLVPQQTDSTLPQQLIDTIIDMLISDTELLRALQAGDWDAARQTLHNDLAARYSRLVQTRLGISHI